MAQVSPGWLEKAPHILVFFFMCQVFPKFSLDTQRRALLYSRPLEASSYHLTVGDRHPHLSPQRHDRREPKEEIARLNALGERLANGLREAYDTDALKKVRPVVERGD